MDKSTANLCMVKYVEGKNYRTYIRVAAWWSHFRIRAVCTTIQTNLKTNTTGYRRLIINIKKTVTRLLVSIVVLSADRHLIARILNSPKSSFSDRLTFGAIFLRNRSYSHPVPTLGTLFRCTCPIFYQANQTEGVRLCSTIFLLVIQRNWLCQKRINI